MHADRLPGRIRAAFEAQAPLSKDERDILMEGVSDTPDPAQLHAMLLEIRSDLNELNELQAKDAEIIKAMSHELQNTTERVRRVERQALRQEANE